jgi:lipopolysaccharide/colanic/teichoic acid biosynthesis glycosyltransferase
MSNAPPGPTRRHIPDPHRRRGRAVSRIFDVACVLLAIGVLAPLSALASLFILLEDGPPVLFLQERVGAGGKRFYIFKFRTMKRKAEQCGKPITVAGDDRVTRVGSVLRRLKLDELPQLVNVLKGDMSLCGPRPEVPCYVDLRDPVWQAVLEERPGITDPASLVYRNEEEVLARASDVERLYRQSVLPEKLQLSLRYMRSRSLWSDLKLILLTVRYSFLPGHFDRSLIERLLL